MFSKILKSTMVAALAGGLFTGAVQAYEAGNWLVRAGVWGIYPESDNLTFNVNRRTRATLDVDDGYSLGFNITYMVNPNIGIELLGAWPFKHDISMTGAGKVAETKQLPPTLFVQYHFMPSGTIHPYVGVGLNYTNFFSEKTKGALSGASLKLEDSWGAAGQLGIDIDVAPNWFVNADISYMNIETDAKVNGVGIGTVKINPWVVGLNVGTRF
ncbi:MAG: outer membrane beta-barrel protein [Gammaproteobacteria bacterium]|nr:outer membrane beta-barrel protein [Gammaproteobacteria bacterium]